MSQPHQDSPATHGFDRCLAVYKQFRDYIQHEDQLINHRTTWLITVQSFLWATYGLSYQKKYEVYAKLKELKLDPAALGSATEEYNGFMLVLAVVGLFTALVSYFSVKAAADAIDSLNQQWMNHPMKKLADGMLPGITGGGNIWASWFGILISKGMPVLFSFLWALTLLVILSSKRWAMTWTY